MRACALACIWLSACATQPPYNPYHLASNPRTRVGELCEKVMQLRPQEPLQPGYWPGDPDPGFWTNSYRACVATLSRSLTQIAAAQDSARTDAHADSSTNTAGNALAAHLAEPLPSTFSSLKEDWVCAQLGLEPPGGAFTRCVKDLQNALMAKDLNANYLGN